MIPAQASKDRHFNHGYATNQPGDLEQAFHLNEIEFSCNKQIKSRNIWSSWHFYSVLLISGKAQLHIRVPILFPTEPVQGLTILSTTHHVPTTNQPEPTQKIKSTWQPKDLLGLKLLSCTGRNEGVRKLLKVIQVKCESSANRILKNRCTLSKDNCTAHGKSRGGLEH